jgi:hypothetical protein
MAVNVKRTAIAAGLIAAAIVIFIALYAGLFYLMSGGMRAEIKSLKSRVTALEKQLADAGATSAAPSVNSAQNNAAVNEDLYKGWATYQNTKTGYTVRYPADWKVTAESYAIGDKPAEYVVFISPNSQYYIAIGLKKKGSDTILTGRNGIGKGTMSAAGTVKVLGIKLKRTELIYKNEIKTMFYPKAEGLFEAVGYQGYAEFGKQSAASTDKYNLKGVPELVLAEKILASLSIGALGEATTTDQTAAGNQTVSSDQTMPSDLVIPSP